MSSRRAIVCMMLCTLSFACVNAHSTSADSSANNNSDQALCRALKSVNHGYENVKAIEDALRKGANPDVINDQCRLTPLSQALHDGWVEAAEVLLEGGADPNFCPKNKPDDDTRCPLTGGSYIQYSPPSEELDKDRTKIVRLLLRAGVDPDGKSLDTNPLAEALLRGKTDIAEMLLDAGANPLGTKDRMTPLWAAFAGGQTAFAQRLMQAGATLQTERRAVKDATLFVRAAENRDSLAIALLLKLGLDPNLPEQCEAMKEACAFFSSNPLQISTTNDCTECVKYLLQAGAHFDQLRDASPDNSYGISWFTVIGRTGPNTLAALFAHGLNPRARDKYGQTLLHIAALGDKAGSIDWLTRHGVDVDAVDERGQTALMLAAVNGRIDVVKALLDAKANVSIHDASGATAKTLAYGVEDDHRYSPVGFRFRSGLKSAAVLRLLGSYGAREFAGDHLPASSFDSELVGKHQYDLTGEFYKELPFLLPGQRFFAAYQPYVASSDSLPPPPVTFFVVHPDNKVDRLNDVQDFSKVEIRLRSAPDALALVRFIPGQDIQIASSFNRQLEANELDELPGSGPCIDYPAGSLKAAGIPQSVATVVNGAKNQYFIVTRFMVPRSLHIDGYGGGSEVSIKNVTKISERVAVDGSYSVQSETLATPRLVVTEHCGKR